MNRYFLIFILCILCFLPFLGSVHLLDWDEANFAELAREMIVSGDYLQPQINFLPFYEKPPLFIWFQVLSMKLFGVNEFAARFPNVICGILVLISLYKIGRRHFGEQFGILFSMSFGASIAPHFYFKTGLIDPFFNFFIFLSIYHFSFLFLSENSNRWKHTVYSALFTALAIMTKGPVALIIIVGSLALTWVLVRFNGMRNLGFIVPWTLVTIGLSSLWFLYITKSYGDTYVKEFIKYQIRLFATEDAKHGGTILFHPIALLLGCFPASIFMWSAFKRNISSEDVYQSIFFKAMASCGIIVLVVFSLVKTKIIHYSSMDYYPIAFFSAYGIQHLIKRNQKLPRWIILGLSVVVLLWGVGLTILPFLGSHVDLVKTYIGDKNFLEQLQAPIIWHSWMGIFGILYLAIFFYGLYKSKTSAFKGITIIFFSSIFLIQIISFYYLPRIEMMVQGSMVEFAKSLNGKDVNTQTLYLKSYNQFFYSNRQPFQNIEDTFRHLHYLFMPIKKDCYFILRTIDTSKLDSVMGPNTEKLYNKSGYTFYLRTIN